jgi:CRP-like cAMP-binding protein
MSVVMVHAIPDDVLIGERERLLAMVDILETVPLEEMRKLARRSAFTRRQLATMIGANRETVTRAFGKLRSEGA